MGKGKDKNNNRDDDDKDDDKWRGRDQIEYATCGHGVQSNNTCGMYGCENFGKR